MRAGGVRSPPRRPPRPVVPLVPAGPGDRGQRRPGNPGDPPPELSGIPAAGSPRTRARSPGVPGLAAPRSRTSTPQWRPRAGDLRLGRPPDRGAGRRREESGVEVGEKQMPPRLHPAFEGAGERRRPTRQAGSAATWPEDVWMAPRPPPPAGFPSFSALPGTTPRSSVR